MVYMKIKIKFLFVFLLTTFYLISSAQFNIDANPAVLNAELLFNSTAQIGKFTFEYSQGGEMKNFDEKQPVKMTVCFMNVKPANGEKSVGGEAAKNFEWTYTENLNCFRGVQINHIEGKAPGKISIVVKAKGEDIIPEHKNIGFIANIQPAPKMNQTNDTEDDAVSEYQKVNLVRNLMIAEKEKN